MKAIGTQVYLRLLNTLDVTKDYVDWMNDPEVNQFTESRWQSHTIESTMEYVAAVEKNKSNFLFGIFLLSNDCHIGNVKIGNIHPIHRSADIGMIIGRKDNWTKGVGSEVLLLVEKIAFQELNLNKIWGGIYSCNIGSFKMTQKSGWREVGRFTKHVFYKGEFVDVIIVEKLIR